MNIFTSLLALLLLVSLAWTQVPLHKYAPEKRSIPSVSQRMNHLVPATVFNKWNDTILQVHFQKMPIQEVAQALSKSYGLNLMIEDDLQLEISLNLNKIGLVDGLLALAKAHDLSLRWEKGVFYLGKHREKVHQRIGVAKRLEPMDLDVSNQEILAFIRHFAKQTGIQVLAGKGLDGRVTGFWKKQEPLSAFRSLMDAHGYQVKRSGEFWIVFPAETETTASQSRKRRTSGVQEVIYSKELLSLNLQEANLKEVLLAIAEEAKLNMVFYGEINERINARIEKASIHDAFASLLRGTRYTYQIPADGIILVGLKDPKSPAGKVLTTYEVYPLQHMKAEEVLKALPHSISKGSLIVIKEQNAVLITGTLAEIQNIKEYLKVVDAPAPQVMLECVIVEYSRGEDMEYGVKVADNTLASNSSPEIGISLNQKGGQWVGRSDVIKSGVGILPNDFLLRLTALENENKAKVLAMPRVTTLNGNKASIKVTNTSYYQVSSVSGQGLPINDFKPINDGITLDITPFITQVGEITMDIKPEIKTSSPSSTAGPANISTRNLQTTVQLGDGETIILGGLIQANQNRIREAVPILGAIPFLGKLFSYYKDVETTTELVVFVTPRVIHNKSLDINRALEQIEYRDLDGDLGEKYNKAQFDFSPQEPKFASPETSTTIEEATPTLVAPEEKRDEN